VLQRQPQKTPSKRKAQLLSTMTEKRLLFLFVRLVFSLCLLPNVVHADTYDPATGKKLNTVAHCIHAINQISKNGYGSTTSSCMGCDPALPNCYFNCPPLVKNLYHLCDSMCIPDGFYFDPKKTMKGCFSDNLKNMKISVERCGCSAAMSSRNNILFIVISILLSMAAIALTSI